MDRRRSFGRYRLIDLGLWLIIMAVFETIVARAALSWFPAQAYYVSVVPVVSAIVYMRWGAWGIIHAIAGGAITCLAMGFESNVYLAYVLGNALSLGACGLIRLMGSEKIRADALKTLLYGFVVFLLMIAGRSLVMLLQGASLQQIYRRFAPEIVTLLFTEVIVWIVKRLDGVFEPQGQYVKRISKEQEQERGENP